MTGMPPPAPATAAATAAAPAPAPAAPAPAPGSRRVTLTLAALALASLAAVALYLSLDLRGNLAFALELRLTRLAALVQVALAVAVGTVVFQTVTGNRILTPYIMGIDQLYILIQFVLVFALGGLGFAQLPAGAKFAGETALMVALAVALFVPLLRHRGSLILMLLAGVVLGVLFRSLSQLVARMIDPNEFAVLQRAMFADFNTIQSDLILPCLVLTLAGTLLAWRLRHALDIMALGADTAIGLGIAWQRTALGLIALTGVLVAVSTALVGPVSFLGLLVAALAERLIGTQRHAALLPAAALTATLMLVGGQALLEHGLDNVVPLASVIEFAGGLLFLALLTTATWR